jgi:hypothetical protein
VGGDDVTHVGGGEAERPELSQCSRLLARSRAHQQAEGAAELARVARVVDAEPGVDQHQPLAGLDRQAVADHMRLLQ